MTAEEGVTTSEAVIASQVIGKAYFYPDVWGSTVFATTKEGSILRYGEREIWGELRLSMAGELNSSGLETGFGFTSYEYDSIMEKYYAKARFYDSTAGRMMSLDPIRRGLNGYLYCNNEPSD